MINIFEDDGPKTFKSRLARLSTESEPQWGKMSVDQMLAHCNVMFDMTFTEKYKKFSALKVFLFRLLIKKAVTGPRPYPKNSRTAPEFIVADHRDFMLEKDRLINYINHVNELGEEHFEGKFYRSFGKMTAQEWNTLFSKHLDHHLQQFGV